VEHQSIAPVSPKAGREATFPAGQARLALAEHATWVGPLSNGVPFMSDDKSKVGEPDRSPVIANQDYEVEHLAEKYGLTSDQARDLIERIGDNREQLEEAAEFLYERVAS
jgi:hypothetical protein